MKTNRLYGRRHSDLSAGSLIAFQLQSSNLFGIVIDFEGRAEHEAKPILVLPGDTLTAAGPAIIYPENSRPCLDFGRDFLLIPSLVPADMRFQRMAMKREAGCVQLEEEKIVMYARQDFAGVDHSQTVAIDMRAGEYANQFTGVVEITKWSLCISTLGDTSPVELVRWKGV